MIEQNEDEFEWKDESVSGVNIWWISNNFYNPFSTISIVSNNYSPIDVHQIIFKHMKWQKREYCESSQNRKSLRDAFMINRMNKRNCVFFMDFIQFPACSMSVCVFVWNMHGFSWKCRVKSSFTRDFNRRCERGRKRRGQRTSIHTPFFPLTHLCWIVNFKWLQYGYIKFLFATAATAKNKKFESHKHHLVMTFFTEINKPTFLRYLQTFVFLSCVPFINTMTHTCTILLINDSSPSITWRWTSSMEFMRNLSMLGRDENQMSFHFYKAFRGKLINLSLA